MEINEWQDDRKHETSLNFLSQRASHGGNSEVVENSISNLSTCPSGRTGLQWENQPEKMNLNHTRGLRAPFSLTPLLSYMKLLLAKAQDWDQVVILDQSPPHFSSLETNTLEVRTTLKTISLLPVLAWRGLFIQL